MLRPAAVAGNMLPKDLPDMADTELRSKAVPVVLLLVALESAPADI